MRLVTWNIRAGGGAGVARVADVLHALDADVAVLTETTSKRTPELWEALRRRGLSHVEATEPPQGEYGALIASRAPSRRVPLGDGPAPHRAILVAIDRHALAFAGCYMPLPASGSRGSSLQVDFWKWLTAALDLRRHESIVAAGDWNTCKAVDGAGRDLPCADHLAALQARGWRSAFRALHPEARARSWWHPSGSAFRIDDAYLSPTFRGTVCSADYVTSVGEHALVWDRRGSRPKSTLSDHAALVVDLGASESPIELTSGTGP